MILNRKLYKRLIKYIRNYNKPNKETIFNIVNKYICFNKNYTR